MKKSILVATIVLLTVVGVHFMYEAYVLKNHPIDGTGVGFHLFGLDYLVNNEDISSTSLKTFILGLVFILVSGLLVTFNKNIFKTK